MRIRIWQVAGIFLCLSLIGIVLGLRFFNKPSALVHLTFPEGYVLMDSAGLLDLSGNEKTNNVSMYLSPGMHTLRFSHSGQLYAAVVFVHDGGEVYDGLTEDDIRAVKHLKDVQ